MEIKITKEENRSRSISSDFIIEFDVRTDKNKFETVELEFNKWAQDSDDGNYDNGVEFTADSQVIFDALSEEQQDQINDFITDIKL